MRAVRGVAGSSEPEPRPRPQYIVYIVMESCGGHPMTAGPLVNRPCPLPHTVFQSTEHDTGHRQYVRSPLFKKKK